ncbi:hypothetical protein SNEBB_006275 [Seison nebaliae]|nr:hypothetical protein SNEBB_006275 [Seison nebaliae]
MPNREQHSHRESSHSGKSSRSYEYSTKRRSEDSSRRRKHDYPDDYDDKYESKRYKRRHNYNESSRKRSNVLESSSKETKRLKSSKAKAFDYKYDDLLKKSDGRSDRLINAMGSRNTSRKSAKNLTENADIKLNLEDVKGKTDEEIDMMMQMGFASFGTTKNKCTGNTTNLSGANILQKRKYRQYMNRKGGFNRPLDSIT